MVHCLARLCADGFVGGTNADRSKPAWRQTYRALDHGTAKNACRDRILLDRFPPEIQDFAYTFVDMQERRHAADYDPFAQFVKSEVKADIEVISQVIDGLSNVSARDKRAFAAHVLFKKR